MDVRSSALVPALYLVLGLAVVGIAFFGFLIYRPPEGQRATEQFADATQSDKDTRMQNAPRVSNRAAETHAAYAKAVQRVLHLEELLDKRTRLLERKGALLQRKDEEYRQLKQEVDDYIMLLAEPGPMDKPEEGPTPLGNQESAQTETAALQAQLEQLKSRLAETESAERLLEEELAMLKEDLNAAYAEMAEQQLASVVVEQEDAVPDVAARLLVSMGGEVIPDVVDLLSDRRAEVRVWAVTLLGRFGPIAEDTVPQLRELRSDPDARVREAAGRAIDMILD